jgi:hypothetical protein
MQIEISVFLTTCRDFKVNIYMYKEVSKDYDHWTTTHHHVVSIPTATFDLCPTTTDDLSINS